MVQQCDEEQSTSVQQDKHTLTDIQMKAWQLCGDIHCLSTKVSVHCVILFLFSSCFQLSESFLSHLEEFRTQNLEDKFILSVVTSLYQLQGAYLVSCIIQISTISHRK